MKFEIIKMYCDNLNQDCWYVARIKEVKGLPYYYGPFRFKAEAERVKKDLEGDI